MCSIPPFLAFFHVPKIEDILSLLLLGGHGHPQPPPHHPQQGQQQQQQQGQQQPLNIAAASANAAGSATPSPVGSCSGGQQQQQSAAAVHEPLTAAAVFAAAGLHHPSAAYGAASKDPNNLFNKSGLHGGLQVLQWPSTDRVVVSQTTTCMLASFSCPSSKIQNIITTCFLQCFFGVTPYIITFKIL